MNKKCLDLTDIEFNSYDEVIRELQDNFYPECEIIEESDWLQGDYKYSWDGSIVFKYFNQKYLVTLRAFGNGGWLSIDDYRVISVKPIKKTITRMVEVKEYIV